MSEVNEKPPFSREQTYGWNPDDEFTLTGSELEMLVSSSQIDSTLQLTHRQWLVKSAQMHILESLMKQGYDKGILTPADPQQ